MTSWKELPFKELHQEAEIKEGVDHKEKAVPESNPGVEGAEIQVIIVTDSSDDCKSETFLCHNQLLALPPSDSHLLQAKKNQFQHFTPMHLLETPLNSHSCTSKAMLHQHKPFSPSSTRNGKIFPPTTAQSIFPRNWGHKSSWNLEFALIDILGCCWTRGLTAALPSCSQPMPWSSPQILNCFFGWSLVHWDQLAVPGKLLIIH